jgi:hypothetical protein
MTVAEMEILRPSTTAQRDAEKIRSAIERHYHALSMRGHGTVETADPREHSFQSVMQPCLAKVS